MNLLSATTLRTPRQTVKKQPNKFLEIFNPSVTTCHLLYMANATPRNTTGHGRGRGGCPNPFPLLRVFSTPPTLCATSPIARGACAGQEVNTFLFSDSSVTTCPLSLYFVWRHILHRVARNGKGRVSPQPHYFGELYYPSPLCGVSHIGEVSIGRRG